jgi:hypothetical protein
MPLMDVEAEIRRVAKLLETEIHVAGSSKRSVEKKLEVGAGYLTKVIKGGLELRVRHILEVAEATGFDVAEFFHKAFPRKPGAEGGTLSLPISEEELTEKVERAVARQVRPIEARLKAIQEALPAALPPAEEATGGRAAAPSRPARAAHRARRPGRRS